MEMKNTKDRMSTRYGRPSGKSLAQASVASRRKLAAQIMGTKEAILAESLKAFGAPERMLTLALNEAEALAWQTSFPQLVFSLLAHEKVQAVFAWDQRQKVVKHRRNDIQSFAA